MKYIFSILLLFQTSLTAEWQPAAVLNLSPKQYKRLCNPKYISFRSTILKHVQGSWCSQKKAELLFELVVLIQPKICVEIGAYQGASTFPMLSGLRYNKSGKIYIVDAWSNTAAIQGLPCTDINTVWWRNTNLFEAKKKFYKMMRSWSFLSFAIVLDMTSKEAIKQIPQIDLLHLDGNCSEIGALQDSQRYVCKVAPGGYIVVSNAFAAISGTYTKIKALWPILEQCDIICEIDDGNTLLFRKR